MINGLVDALKNKTYTAYHNSLAVNGFKYVRNLLSLHLP